ncbi:MAG: hypothetical protein KC561_17815, partial [Myxococcales bacterium]|nr:hypothetical protein [Myxococcales bacterium]
MTRRFSGLALGSALLGLVAGCAEEVTPPVEEPIPTMEDDLVAASPGGKFDTGYLSNLAVELEGQFESHIVVDYSDLSGADREAAIEAFSTNTSTIRRLIDEQIKFSKNQLNAAQLHLNLSASDAEFAIEFDENGIGTVTYTTTVETIVTSVELEEEGVSIEEVLNGNYAAVIPDQPERMADDVGAACISEGDR